MLKAPVEGLDAAIVVGGPAAVLVAADFAFESVHDKSRQFTVYSQELANKKVDGLKEANEGFQHRVHRGPQRTREKKALGMRHGG